MSPATTTSKRKKKKTSATWSVWWPLLLGVLITPFAVRAAGVMALAGPAALRTLYPYVQLEQSPVLGFSGELASVLSQAMMYLQFPLYGLLFSLLLRRKGFGTALLTTAIIHFGAVAIAVSLAHL